MQAPLGRNFGVAGHRFEPSGGRGGQSNRSRRGSTRSITHVVESVDRRHKEHLVAGGAALATVVFALWLAFHVGGDHGVRDFDDVVTALAALSACVACWFAAARLTGAIRRFWVLLGVALAAWTVAEVIWAGYNVVLSRPVPVTSWADVGYLGAIPIAAAALLCHPGMHAAGARKARATLDGVAIGTAVIVLSWALVLGRLWHHTNLSTLGGIVALAYPFGDVLIIFLIVLSIGSISAQGRRPLLWVLAGLFAMAVSDSTYAYLVEVNRYTTGNFVDVGWAVAYLAIAVGAVSENGWVVRTETAEATEPSLASVAAPFLPVLLALSAVTYNIERHRTIDRFEWLAAFGLALLVVARQALALFDRRRQASSSLNGSGLEGASRAGAVHQPEPAGGTK